MATKVSGVILNSFAPKQRGKYRIFDFVLKSNEGKELKVSAFTKFDTNLVGELVTFNANYNEEYDRYTVVGDISTMDSPVTEPENTPEKDQDVDEPKQPKKRGRPKNQGTSLKSKNVNEDLESVREDAEAIVEKDIEFATGVLGNATPEAVATLVQALQSVRATLFIEANKRERVANWK